MFSYVSDQGLTVCVSNGGLLEAASLIDHLLDNPKKPGCPKGVATNLTAYTPSTVK